MFHLPRHYAQEMIAHAQEEAPNECCGVMAGIGGKVTALFRTQNAARSPTRYQVDPLELLRIDKEIEANHWEWLGIYHSHPFSEAYPSATDIRLAFWPDSLYFIISLKEENDPQIRAFWIRESQVNEEPLIIE
ncbi:MAG: M67 family metallopeptidase [Chloroflexi bacterium]|nr:M67 family metallopeptidase [Chloroflexota bacterium]